MFEVVYLDNTRAIEFLADRLASRRWTYRGERQGKTVYRYRWL